MIRFVLLTFLLSIFFQGCTLREKELALQNKEQELIKKEQDLVVRENNLKLREQEFANKLKADSLATDSSFYNTTLIGIWETKMTCTETTCTGSAVGDTKTERWEISYEGKNVVAKAMDGSKMIRLYSGMYTGNTVELIEEREATGSQPSTKMVVRLRLTGDDTMEGQREILRPDCKIIYSLNLVRQTREA